MKKMRNSKRGFTLTEIIIVVAIIVIVSSAAFVGVAVVLQKARDNSDEVNRRHGTDADGKDLFEAEAWGEIDELTKDAANFFDVALYKPVHTNTPTVTPTPTDTPSNGGGGGSSDATATPKATATPQATNTQPPTATPEPTKASGNTSGNASYNKVLTSGTASVTADKNKTIKSITVTYKNNQNNYSQFYVTYKGGPNGNFNNANNYVGINANETGSVTFTPQTNGQNLTGCESLVFNHAQGNLTIVGYTIEYM